MKAYVDTAKSFVQLSSAGLALPVVLNARVLGLFGRTSSEAMSLTVRIGVGVSWICFLTAIAAGALYQYAAIKSAEWESDPGNVYVSFLIRPLVKRGPGMAYGVMVSAFYVGAIGVVVYSACALLNV